MVDNAIHWINHYLLDSTIGFAKAYPLDSDLSGGYCYPSFEQLEPGLDPVLISSQGHLTSHHKML